MLTAIGDVMRRVYERGWVTTRDGNISMRKREGQQPSGELWMHWNLQRDERKTRTVVHVHATHIVAAMYAGVDLQASAQSFPKSHAIPRWDEPCPRCRPCHVNWRTPQPHASASGKTGR